MHYILPKISDFVTVWIFQVWFMIDIFDSLNNPLKSVPQQM